MTSGSPPTGSAGRQAAARRRAILLEAELSDPPDTALARLLICVGLAAVFGALVWAYNAPLKEVVVGEGRILPWRESQLLQHKDGGRVVSVFVREGDLVKPGDPVVRFDRSDEIALVAQLDVRAAALEAELARARAVAEGHGYERQTHAGDAPALASVQSEVFDIQSEARKARQAVLQADADLAEARVAEAKETIHHLSRREALQVKRLQDIERLSGARGVVSRRDRDAAEIAVIETQVDIAAARAAARTAQLEVQRARNAISDFILQERRAAIELAADLEARLAETRKEIDRRASVASRDVLVAGVEARVQSMDVTGPDQVVAPGGTVAALVPVGQELLAELIVSADRIGSIAPGHRVNVKVLTFDFTRFGAIEGEVVDVSPTSDVGADGTPTYRVRVALAKDHLGAEDGQLEIRPGLAVVGDIVLGERTVMEYLLKPLRVARDRAMTEA